MINAKLQNIIDTKSAIGNAIVNKGGTITGETPFFNYAAQIDGISTGTPQTIFEASDGSKWALTNAVNLVNDAGNVTSDFNYWQPANNSTSDPILNIGTVGANISGNIRLVPVNQVNIAQYENIVINDTTGAKYVGYNGYDQVTNPTPTGNTTFNRWLLNNSASGTVIFANTTITNGGTYNGPNTSLNVANMPLINSSNTYGGSIFTTHINNGFIFVGGATNERVQKFYENNLVFVSSVTNSYGRTIVTLTTNNGFIYAGGDAQTSVNRGIRKYREDNLAVVGNTVNFGGSIQKLVTNNGFVYAGGYFSDFQNGTVRKYGESNLTEIGNTPNYAGLIISITINNGFIYAGGGSGIISKYNESTLSFVGNTGNYGGSVRSITTNNGFIYAGGETLTGVNRGVAKYYESNLALVGNTANYGERIDTVKTNNGFIYAGGEGNVTANRDVKKYYESNLTFAGNTVSYGGGINSILINNGFIYAAGATNQRVKQFQEQSLTPDNQTFYTATKIKE